MIFEIVTTPASNQIVDKTLNGNFRTIHARAGIHEQGLARG